MNKVLSDQNLSLELNNLKTTIQNFLNFTDGGENTLDYIVTKRINDLDITIKEWENDENYLKNQDNVNFVWDLLLNFQTLVRNNPIIKTTTIITQYLEFIKKALIVVDKERLKFLDDVEKHLLEGKTSLFEKGFTKNMGKSLTIKILKTQNNITPRIMTDFIFDFFINIETFLNTIIDIPKDFTIIETYKIYQENPKEFEIGVEKFAISKGIIKYRMEFAKKMMEENIRLKKDLITTRLKIDKLKEEYNQYKKDFDEVNLIEQKIMQERDESLRIVKVKEELLLRSLIIKENELIRQTTAAKTEAEHYRELSKSVLHEKERLEKIVKNSEKMAQIMAECDLEKFPQIFNNLVNLFAYGTVFEWKFLHSENETKKVICEKLEKIFKFQTEYDQRVIDYEEMTEKMTLFTKKMVEGKLDFDDHISKELEALENIKKTINNEYHIIMKYKEYNFNIEKIIKEKKQLEEEICKGFVDLFMESKIYAKDNEIFTQSIVKLTNMKDISITKLEKVLEEIMDSANKAQAQNKYLIEEIKKLEKKHAQEIKALSEKFKAMGTNNVEQDKKLFGNLPAINFLFYYMNKRYKNKKHRNTIDEHHDCPQCAKITTPKFFLNYHITDHLVYFLSLRGYKNIIYYDPKKCCNKMEKIILECLRYLHDIFPSKSILWYRNFLSKKYYPNETTTTFVTPFCNGNKKTIKKEKENIKKINWDRNVTLRYKRFYYTYLIPEISNKNITYQQFNETENKEIVFYKYYLQLNKEACSRVGLKEMSVQSLKKAEKKEKEKILKKYVYYKFIYEEGKFESTGNYKEKPFEKNIYWLKDKENKKYENKLSKMCRDNPHFKLYTQTNVKDLIKKIVIEEDSRFMHDLILAKATDRIQKDVNDGTLVVTNDEKQIVKKAEEDVIMGLYEKVSEKHKFMGEKLTNAEKQEKIFDNLNRTEMARRHRLIKVESLNKEIPSIVLSNKYKIVKSTGFSSEKLAEKTRKEKIEGIDLRREEPIKVLNKYEPTYDGGYIGMYHDSDSDEENEKNLMNLAKHLARKK